MVLSNDNYVEYLLKSENILLLLTNKVCPVDSSREPANVSVFLHRVSLK